MPGAAAAAKRASTVITASRATSVYPSSRRGCGLQSTADLARLNQTERALSIYCGVVQRYGSSSSLSTSGWAVAAGYLCRLASHGQRMLDLQIVIDDHNLFLRNAGHPKSSAEQISTLNIQSFLVGFVLKDCSVEVSRSADDSDVGVIRGWWRCATLIDCVFE